MADAYICRRGGSGSGGGSELVIVGGTTSPAKADHNTIWLNTPNTITNCVLSAMEPTGPVEGMVWITIGASGAVKIASPVGGDWITVYPISAKQYIGGAWVNKTAKSYQGGEWVDWWDGNLFFEGDENTSITGGWTNNGYKYKELPFGAMVNDGTKLNFSYGESSSFSGGGTDIKVDVSIFKTLRIIGVSNYNYGEQMVGLFTDKNLDNSAVAKKNFDIGNVDVTLDISDLTGEYYIATIFYGYATKVVLGA